MPVARVVSRFLVGSSTSLSTYVALKPTAFSGGRETPLEATVIPSLPYSDTGDTTKAIDDFDAVCPYEGSTSPDVFYSFSPAIDQRIRIRLCDSSFDTKTYVLDSSFTEIACNDDGCSSGGVIPFRSDLRDVPLFADETYYIAVDGWSGDAGAYVINVALDVGPNQPCVIQCPPGSIPEGEPCDNGRTEVNPGCDGPGAPWVVSEVECGTTTCGTSWALGGTHDTDWYGLNVPEINMTVTATITAGFNGVLGLFPNGNPSAPDCGSAAFENFVNTSIDDCGMPQSISFFTKIPGQYWLVVKPIAFDLLPCDGSGSCSSNDYVVTWECEPLCDGNNTCPGDANSDGVVSFIDITTVLAKWNQTCP